MGGERGTAFTTDDIYKRQGRPFGKASGSRRRPRRRAGAGSWPGSSIWTTTSTPWSSTKTRQRRKGERGGPEGTPSPDTIGALRGAGREDTVSWVRLTCRLRGRWHGRTRV